MAIAACWTWFRMMTRSEISFASARMTGSAVFHVRMRPFVCPETRRPISTIAAAKAAIEMGSMTLMLVWATQLGIWTREDSVALEDGVNEPRRINYLGFLEIRHEKASY